MLLCETFFHGINF